MPPITDKTGQSGPQTQPAAVDPGSSLSTDPHTAAREGARDRQHLQTHNDLGPRDRHRLDDLRNSNGFEHPEVSTDSHGVNGVSHGQNDNRAKRVRYRLSLDDHSHANDRELEKLGDHGRLMDLEGPNAGPDHLKDLRPPHRDAVPGPSRLKELICNANGHPDHPDDLCPDDSADPHQLKDPNPDAETKTKRVSRMQRYSQDHSAALECFRTEPCLHSQRVLAMAATILRELRPDIFRVDRHRRRQSEPATTAAAAAARHQNGANRRRRLSWSGLEFRGPEEKRRVFELVFAVLDYQSLFESILVDCDFFKLYPELTEDVWTVMTVLWDYQSRKFQPRHFPGPDEPRPVVEAAEQAVVALQTRLKASLARLRIEKAAPDLQSLLPNKGREARRGSSSLPPPPLCAWVNGLKTELEIVMGILKKEGLSQAMTPPDTCQQLGAHTFCLDPHCPDLLVFSPDCASVLDNHHLLQHGHLVLQDKTLCMAAHSVVTLLGDGEDVMVVGAHTTAGRLPAHIALLLRERAGRVIVVSPPTRAAAGRHDDDGSDDEEEEEEGRERMMKENDLVGVAKYLKVVRRMSDSVDPTDRAGCLQQLQTNHRRQLQHTLSLPMVRGVVYLTRSLHQAENEMVVEEALDVVNAKVTATTSTSTTNAGGHLLPWQVIPPVLPLLPREMEGSDSVLDGQMLCFPPSDMGNGCFLVCLARRPLDMTDAAAGRTKVKHRHKPLHHTPSDNSKDSADASEASSPNSKSRRRSSMRRKSCPALPDRLICMPKVELKPRVPEHHKVIFHPLPFK